MKVKSKTLAQALWEDLKGKNYEEVNHAIQGMGAFLRLYKLESEIRDFMNHPKTEVGAKIKVIHEFMRLVKAPAEAEGLIRWLVEKKGMTELPRIISLLHQWRNEKFNVVSAEVTGAAKLTEPQKQDLETRLKEAFDAKQVEMGERVDQTILGGVVLRINGQRLDASLKTKLKKVKQAVLNS